MEPHVDGEKVGEGKGAELVGMRAVVERRDDAVLLPAPSRPAPGADLDSARGAVAVT